jgi:hypothetical protein
MVCNCGTGVPLVEVPLKGPGSSHRAARASELGGQAIPISDGAEYGVDELAAEALSGELARRKVDRNARAHPEPLDPVEAARRVGVELKRGLPPGPGWSGPRCSTSAPAD